MSKENKKMLSSLLSFLTASAHKPRSPFISSSENEQEYHVHI